MQETTPSPRNRELLILLPSMSLPVLRVCEISESLKLTSFFGRISLIVLGNWQVLALMLHHIVVHIFFFSVLFFNRELCFGWLYLRLLNELDFAKYLLRKTAIWNIKGIQHLLPLQEQYNFREAVPLWLRFRSSYKYSSPWEPSNALILCKPHTGV